MPPMQRVGQNVFKTNYSGAAVAVTEMEMTPAGHEYTCNDKKSQNKLLEVGFEPTHSEL